MAADGSLARRINCLACVCALLVSGVPALAESTLPAAVFQAYEGRPGEVLTWTDWEAQTPFLKLAAIPFVPRTALVAPPDPEWPATPPYDIDPGLSQPERERVAHVAESLRISATGRRLVACLHRAFASPRVPGRSVTLTSRPWGVQGDRAQTTGRPPAYVVTLNRDLLRRDGPAGMVPKLAHELVHIHDFERGVQRSVALEVSGHAADAAVTFEGNWALSGTPHGPFGALSSVMEIYMPAYVPFRRHPTLEGHATYWRELMALVVDRRAYRAIYLDADGQTVWNSPAGPPGPKTYVPYDPAFGLPRTLALPKHALAIRRFWGVSGESGLGRVLRPRPGGR